MTKKDVLKIKPILSMNYEEIYNYEIEGFVVFPIITNKEITNYRIWNISDKIDLCDNIGEELYWDGYDSSDFERIKRNYNYPIWLVFDICNSIEKIEKYFEA